MKQTVSIQMGDGHIVKETLHESSKDGFAVSNSFEKLVFSDLQEMLFKGRTLEQHYERVTTTRGTSYNGVNRFAYGNVIKALQTIIESKRKHLRKLKQKEAIAFLHQDVKLSPNLIQNLVRLFGVKLDISKILRASNSVFAERPQPRWLQNIGGANIC